MWLRGKSSRHRAEKRCVDSRSISLFFMYDTFKVPVLILIFLNPSTALYHLFLVKLATDLRCCISASLRVAVIGGTIFDRVLEQFNSVSCRLRHSTAARRLLWDKPGI